MSRTILLIVSMLLGWIFEAFPATVSLSSFGNIQSALDECSVGDTISLTGNSTLTSSVTVNKSVTILGNGYTVTRGSPGSGRAVLECRYTWPCSAPDCTRTMSPWPAGSSYLPFSPLPPLRKAVVFCCNPHELAPICAFHRALPCAARTFLRRLATPAMARFSPGPQR